MANNEMCPADKAKCSITNAADMENLVRHHLSDLSGRSTTCITRDCDLSHDLSLDSLDELELAMWCEYTFGINVSDEEANSLETVGELFDFISCKKGWC